MLYSIAPSPCLDIVYPEQAAITINDPSWHEPVKDLNSDVQDCLQKLLSALNARASLLAHGAQLDGVMGDATVMISITLALCREHVFIWITSSVRAQNVP